MVEHQNKEIYIKNILFEFCKYLVDLDTMIDEEGNEITRLICNYYFDELTYEFTGNECDYLLIKTIGFDPEDAIFDEVNEFEVPLSLIDLYLAGMYNEVLTVWKDICKKTQDERSEAYLQELKFKARCIGYKLVSKDK